MMRETSWKVAELTLDRIGTTSLVQQIAEHIEAAISGGALVSGMRLPSWRDLAAQLGVSRGTVRAAYECLIDKSLIITAGSAGTRIADTLPPKMPLTDMEADNLVSNDSFSGLIHASVFGMGVPAHDAFPVKLWARLHRQAVQATAALTFHPDRRGLSELRAALAAHVAITRGVECSPDQIIVTTGFRGGLSIALRAIGVAGCQVWMEDPGFPVTRHALELSGLQPVAVPVDAHGLNVERGRKLAPGASLAVVTPGQQSPSGVVLSPSRRQELLRWAREADAWVIEDDYLAELHLSGRSPNALASGNGADRVIYVGSFSKTISPMLGLGFLVAPRPLARRLIEAATWLGAPPGIAVQTALTTFLREGHYLRHLRRMRRLYSHRRSLLLETLMQLGVHNAIPAGLSVVLSLPNGFDDQQLVTQAQKAGLALTPLSPWFAAASADCSGLLLGIANVTDKKIRSDCTLLLNQLGNAINEMHGTPWRLRSTSGDSSAV